MLLNCGVGEDSWESLGLQGDPISPSQRKSVLNIHWKDWCWSWNSNTFATWCEGLTHLNRPWCRERLRAGGEGDDRGWDGSTASLTQWTWVWVGSRSWWWTGRPGVLQSIGSQRVRHDWVTELKTTFRFAYVTKAERLILKIWESFRKRIYFRRVKSKILQNIGFTFSSLHVEENLKAMSWKWTRHLIFDKWRVACNLILVALY